MGGYPPGPNASRPPGTTTRLLYLYTSFQITRHHPVIPSVYRVYGYLRLPSAYRVYGYLRRPAQGDKGIQTTRHHPALPSMLEGTKSNPKDFAMTRMTLALIALSLSGSALAEDILGNWQCDSKMTTVTKAQGQRIGL